MSRWPAAAGGVGQGWRGGPWTIGGKGMPDSTISVGRGTGHGGQRACERSSRELCLARANGLWREQREIY